MLSAIIDFLRIPLLLLNIGAAVSGIWLVVLGEWQLFGIGLLLLFIYKWVLSILMIPGKLLGNLSLKFYDNNNPIKHFFAYATQLYTNLIILGTCILASYICSSYYSGDVNSGYIPYLLWSWGMALYPWQFFQWKEPDNELLGITLFCASLLYLIFLISLFISPYFTSIFIIIIGLFLFIILPTGNIYFVYNMRNSDNVNS